jgi:hypothetical protein
VSDTVWTDHGEWIVVRCATTADGIPVALYSHDNKEFA